MKKSRSLLIGLPFLVILLFLGPSILAGYSNTTHIDGYYADEYPYGYLPANHPEISSWNQYVAIVYVIGSGDGREIKMAYSSNYGYSFSYEDVYVAPEVIQDYPDVQIYMDTADSNDPKAVVVWQQKPDDDSEEWEIKAREWSFGSSDWEAGVLSVSDTSYEEDDNDNIYPKVSTCSDNSVSYWNIVWQRDWDEVSNRYGIYLRRYIRDTSTEGFNSIRTIAFPDGCNDDYTHPATDCIPSENDFEIIYIVFDEFHYGDPSENIIYLTYGSPSGSAWGTFTESGNKEVATSENGDLSQDFPDIAAIESADGNNIFVDCVWIENSQSDEVWYARSENGGAEFIVEPTDIDGDKYGLMELRAVAIDTNISTYASSPYSTEYCHIIWTNGNDIFFREINGTGGSWDPMSGIQTGSSMVELSETFVDVSTSDASPGSITAHVTWQVSGTAVFYGSK